MLLDTFVYGVCVFVWMISEFGVVRPVTESPAVQLTCPAAATTFSGVSQVLIGWALKHLHEHHWHDDSFGTNYILYTVARQDNTRETVEKNGVFGRGLPDGQNFRLKNRREVSCNMQCCQI